MRKVLLASVVVLLFVLTMLPTTAVADPLSKDGTIYHDSFEKIFIGSWSDSGDRKVTVTTNATVDVYILTSDEQYKYPETFTPVKAVEKTTNAEFKFSARSGTTYYLYIDNLDNGRSGDAIPKGDVTYVATYPNLLDDIDIGDDIETFAWTCIGIVVLVVVLIIVVIVVVIYLVTRKKKPAPQPPMTYQQQQQYQQPGYQQQQQPGYTQQSPPPSQYEPPPPSPYEPPPPPPY